MIDTQHANPLRQVASVEVDKLIERGKVAADLRGHTASVGELPPQRIEIHVDGVTHDSKNSFHCFGLSLRELTLDICQGWHGRWNVKAPGCVPNGIETRLREACNHCWCSIPVCVFFQISNSRVTEDPLDQLWYLRGALEGDRTVLAEEVSLVQSKALL